jgi:hypothetical protein
MHTVSDINAVHLTLVAGEKQVLFILLAADGTINRQGTGALTNTDNDLFIGRTEEPLFANLISYLDDEMMKFMGGYNVEDQRGVPCKLLIGLSFLNAEDNGFGFRYGSESKGPPHEIVQFVTAAVRLTDPWFQQQKKIVSKAKGTGGKPWWKFW